MEREKKFDGVCIVDETFDDLKVEIALLKKCHHPKIVEYIGGWQKGSELFIAMELCDGASIDRLMETLGRGLTEPEIAQGAFVCRRKGDFLIDVVFCSNQGFLVWS